MATLTLTSELVEFAIIDKTTHFLLVLNGSSTIPLILWRHKLFVILTRKRMNWILCFWNTFLWRTMAFLRKCCYRIWVFQLTRLRVNLCTHIKMVGLFPFSPIQSEIYRHTYKPTGPFHTKSIEVHGDLSRFWHFYMAWTVWDWEVTADSVWLRQTWNENVESRFALRNAK